MVLENFIVDAPIVWDRVGKKIFENPHVKQGRKMRVQITNAGMVEDLSGYTLALGWKHTVSGVDGLDVFEDSSEANVGIFEMAYTENLMTNLGNLKASLVLTSVEDMVVAESNDFYVKVDDSPFGADAEQGVGSYTRLAQILLNEEIRQEAYLRNEALVGSIDDKFDAFIQTNIVQEEVAEVFNNLEETYAQDLLSVKNGLEQIAINLSKYNIPTDGITDARPAFLAAIAEADSKGGAKIVAPYCNNGYAISGQVTLNYNTELDLQGSVLKPIGAFNVAGSVLTRMRYSGNVIKNIMYGISTAQYGIEFGNTSFKNMEMMCQTTAGYGNLVKTESENIQSYLNRSMTLEAISNGKTSHKNIKKLEFNYVVGANSYTSRKRLRPFPSRCLITTIKVTDINDSPDFSFEIEAPASNYIYIRPRASTNIFENVNLDYFNTSLDDLFLFGIYNHKVTETTFKVEIYYTDQTNMTANKIWEYVSESDFLRPHYDTLAPNTLFSANTVKQVEYRFKDSVGTTHKLGVTPTRKQDDNYQYPQLMLPTPAVTQDVSLYSEVKFYFDYPASKAVVDKPKKLIVNFHKVPKEIKTRLIVGWYSQNPDRPGMAAYLKSIPIVEKDIVIPVTATYDAPYKIEILLDPKGFQAGSAIEGDSSFDFLYFVLWQKDGSYTPYLFGEEYIFNAYIAK